jgi:hypothetical protein
MAFLKKRLSMFYLEVEIVLLGIRPKPNLFNYDLLRFGLNLLLLLLLFVLEFRIINHFTNRRISTRRYFHQIQALILSEFNRLLDRIDIRFNIFPNNPYTLSGYALIYFVRLFWSLRTPSVGPVKTWSAAAIIDKR